MLPQGTQRESGRELETFPNLKKSRPVLVIGKENAATDAIVNQQPGSDARAAANAKECQNRLSN